MMSAVCLLSADCKLWLQIWLSFEIEPKYIMTREPKFYFKWADVMRHVPLERDINFAVNGCSGFATSTKKGPFTAMLISHSRGTYLIG